MECRRRTFLAAISASAFSVGTVSASSPENSWSAPRADQQNSSHSSVAPPTGALGVDWRRSFESRPYIAPVPVGDTCYVSTEAGRVIALEISTGDERWTRVLPERPFLFINPAGRRLIFPTEQGSIYCLNSSTGETNWRRDVGGWVHTPLQVTDTSILFGTTSSDGPPLVVSLDETDGSNRWSSPVQAPVDSTPAIAGDAVVIREKSGDVRALDVRTGDLRWERTFVGNNTPNKFNGPLVKSGRVYVYGVDARVSDRPQITALDATDGTTEWHREISRPYAPIASSQELLYSIHGDAAHALNPDDGTVVWGVDIDGPSGLVSVTDAVYVTSAGSMTVYRARDGREQTRFELNSLSRGHVPLIEAGESFVGRQRPIPGGLLAMTEEAVYALRGGHGGRWPYWVAGGVGIAGAGAYALHRWRDKRSDPTSTEPDS